MLKVIENLQIEQALVKMLKEKEAFQSNRETLDANSVLTLMDERNRKINALLEPLKEALNKDVQVLDMYFTNNDNTGNGIGIKIVYLLNGIEMDFTIYQEFIGETEIISGYNRHMNMELFQKNEEIIAKVFDQLYRYRFEQRLEIPTTSKLFRMECDLEHKEFHDVHNKWIKISIPYKDPQKRKIVCANPHVLEYINLDNQLTYYLENFRVYQDDVPVFLKKLK